MLWISFESQPFVLIGSSYFYRWTVWMKYKREILVCATLDDKWKTSVTVGTHFYEYMLKADVSRCRSSMKVSCTMFTNNAEYCDQSNRSPTSPAFFSIPSTMFQWISNKTASLHVIMFDNWQRIMCFVEYTKTSSTSSWRYFFAFFSQLRLPLCSSSCHNYLIAHDGSLSSRKLKTKMQTAEVDKISIKKFHENKN